jgi:hypothetical protein
LSDPELSSFHSSADYAALFGCAAPGRLVAISQQAQAAAGEFHFDAGSRENFTIPGYKEFPVATTKKRATRH